MTTNSNPKIIILAGATGGLGGRIARTLIRRGDEHTYANAVSAYGSAAMGRVVYVGWFVGI